MGKSVKTESVPWRFDIAAPVKCPVQWALNNLSDVAPREDVIILGSSPEELI